MKNIKVFYLAILIPLGVLFLLINLELIDSTLFMILLLAYWLIYRTYTDGKRLIDKKIIRKKEIWKLIIPGTRIEYFKELYLK
jgi:uncharacterized membrane protein